MTKCNGIEICSVWSLKKWLQICGIRKKAANKRACAYLFATLLFID